MQPEGFIDPPKKIRDMREADVEKHGCGIVEAKGGVAYKFVSPGRNGVPDRLKLYFVPPEHRAIVNRYVKLVEYKRPKGKRAKQGTLSEEQARERRILLALGHCVLVIDTKQQTEELL